MSLKILDFGLSLNTEDPDSEELYITCGTPGYIAPEVISYDKKTGEKYNSKCDIFSTGLTFLKM